jgi:hypothetical protein
MSAIPPDIAGSAVQAGFAARQASASRDADKVGQANASARQAEALRDAANSVDTSDGDTAVFADAEGAGSQGRDYTDDSKEEVDSAPTEGYNKEPGDPDSGSGGQLDLRA